MFTFASATPQITCLSDPAYEMNLTITNSTPVMESMTMDIITDQPPGSACLIRIYDENTCIDSVLPGPVKRDITTPLNALQSLLGDSLPRLIVTPAGTVHHDLWLVPWKYRENYQYIVYAECGSSCTNATFYVDSPRYTVAERLNENFIMSIIKNPIYTIFTILSVLVLLKIIIAIWVLLFK